MKILSLMMIIAIITVFTNIQNKILYYVTNFRRELNYDLMTYQRTAYISSWTSKPWCPGRNSVVYPKFVGLKNHHEYDPFMEIAIFTMWSFIKLKIRIWYSWNVFVYELVMSCHWIFEWMFRMGNVYVKTSFGMGKRIIL